MAYTSDRRSLAAKQGWASRPAQDRVEQARAAAKARWARTPEAERSASARKAALARWGASDRDPRPLGFHGPPRPCVNCGALCARRGGVRFCAKPECRLAFNAWRMRTRYAAAVKKNQAKRRAVERGVEAEDFTHQEIFERDGWLCGLCGGSVDPSLSYPDKKSASLDHVVPLALGGGHTRANSQCAHLDCNMKKGARQAA